MPTLQFTPKNLLNLAFWRGVVGGVVLDPFMGSGTTAKVAQRFDRHYVGFEINPEYVEIAKKKLSAVQKELFV